MSHNKYNIPFFGDGITKINGITWLVNSICHEEIYFNWNIKFRCINLKYFGISLDKSINNGSK